MDRRGAAGSISVFLQKILVSQSQLIGGKPSASHQFLVWNSFMDKKSVSGRRSFIVFGRFIVVSEHQRSCRGSFFSKKNCCCKMCEITGHDMGWVRLFVFLSKFYCLLIRKTVGEKAVRVSETSLCRKNLMMGEERTRERIFANFRRKIFLTLPKKFVWELFWVSELFWCRRIAWMGWAKEGVFHFFLKILLSERTKKKVGDTFCVSKENSYRKM